MFERLTMLNDTECKTVVSTLHALKELWTERNPFAPFYTLGAPSYLDARSENGVKYYQRVEQDNPVLRKHFAWLYECLSNVLSAHLHAQVGYDDRLGLPGFHLFLGSPVFE